MILSTPGELGYIPKRIISLVPSQTELLHYLGLEEETIAITKFCVHPETWFRTKTRVGGTKSLHIEKIQELNPDLIIANNEENVKEQTESLAAGFPVWVTDVRGLESAINMIDDIGTLTGKQTEAGDLNTKIKNGFAHLREYVTKYNPTPIHTAYLIWRDPYMSIGGDTFISDIMFHCGFQNIFKDLKRYPETTIQQLKKMNCELVLLSSEPYPFSEKHVCELQEQLPGIKILLVDGEMFSWYGSRLLKSPSYFQELLQNGFAFKL